MKEGEKKEIATKVKVGERLPVEEPKVNEEKVEVEKKKESPELTVKGLEGLILKGIIEKTENIGGIVVVMHALKESEKLSALGLIKTNDGNISQQLEMIKVANLTYSITKIDDDEFVTEAQKQELFKKLHLSSSGTLIDILYDKYNDIALEQYTIFEDFKKKSSKTEDSKE